MDNKAVSVLAFSLGFLLLFHGVDKILNGAAFIEEMLVAANVPYSNYLTYAVFIGEVVAPVLLIIGKYIKIAGAMVAFNMLVAIILAHKDSIFTLNESGGWSIELQLLYLVGGLTLALLDGKRS